MAGPPGIKARARGFAEVFDRSIGDALTPLSVVIEKVLSPVRAVIEGRETLMFGTNSYLGLNFDPACIAAAEAAMESFGTGSTASRVASGNQALHVGLERQIAELYGRRDAIIFSTGFMANLGAIGGLIREGDAAVLDAHCHASIFDACKLSGAKILTFRHNDAADLARILAECGIAPSRTLVVVEGLYSVLGDLADLGTVSAVTAQLGAVLLVDEAHSLGLYGARGRGVAEAQGVEDKVDIIVGTFSKSVGVVGGYCVTDDPAFRALRFAARSYLYTASLPPPVVAAASQALTIIRDDRDRRRAVFRNAETFHRGLTALGLPPLAPPGPVGAVRMPGIKPGLDTWTALLRAGLYVNMLIPPATPNGEVVLRYSVSAAHSSRDVDAALDIIAATGRQTGVLRPAA
ncbi:aminotransferase class I/II-fold pyridoxal phosphate-dependent enzyme [Labrys okinawensis]|uniref:aminotransferase class I/II-fold pyridoxal phosphate-dependent enzyme n=1 Tax=Labrys okinawensis TaxID=346911 RepID=UPI0039BC6C67